MYIPTNTLISETGLTNCGTVVLDTYPTWTDSTTTYGVAYNNDYISISKDLSEEIRKLGYNLNMVADVFRNFAKGSSICTRICVLTRLFTIQMILMIF